MSQPFKKPSNLLTIYGRKPVQEALQDPDINFFRVHMADSNKPHPILDDILKRCQQRGIEVVYHDRLALSRISKNRKQDQGIAADILGQHFEDFETFLADHQGSLRLIAVDQVTNPQNLGMIIRSVCAGYVDGLLIPRRGCARIDSLVIKASAGTLFKARLLFCDHLPDALKLAQQHGLVIYGLSTQGQPLHKATLATSHIMVLGNESEGLSPAVNALCTEQISIPMRNRVESLNVAVTAGILAFNPLLAGSDKH